MIRASRILRITSLMALPVLLLAASWAPIVDQQAQSFDPLQFHTNRARWDVLPESRRDELRNKWVNFKALPEGEREKAIQRMEFVRRMYPPMRRILGRDPQPSELAVQLEQVRPQLVECLASVLGLPKSTDERAVRIAAAAEVRTRIGSFLDGLVAGGSMTVGERTRILGQSSLSLIIRDGLLRLAAAGGGPALEPGTSDDDTRSLDELWSKVEREGLENARAPEVRGVRNNDLRGGDPMRQRMFKMTYVVASLKTAGYTMPEILEILKRPTDDLDALLVEKLAPH
jgi:hypothetical protein